MTRIRFHQSLDDLKERLLVMAGMAEQAIQRAIEAYRVRDLSICDLVVRNEVAINRLEREIDQMALDLLAMEQPMAIDLRFILAVIKINADLERVGDQAVNITERVRDLQNSPGGRARVFRLDLNQPVSIFVAQQFGMQARDVVFVTNAPLYEYNKIASALYRTFSIVGVARGTTGVTTSF